MMGINFNLIFNTKSKFITLPTISAHLVESPGRLGHEYAARSQELGNFYLTSVKRQIADNIYFISKLFSLLHP